MSNGIDTSSPHYKGSYPDIYAVERKYPNGGTDGDFVVIEGWAHYWNPDRGTWCVNEKRDSYWDELITNLADIIYKIRGASYMGIATPRITPSELDGAKLFYFAKEGGEYSNFSSDIYVYPGVSVIYTMGDKWEIASLIRIEQELGNNPYAVVSQKAMTEIIDSLVNSIVNSGMVLYMSSTMGWSWKDYQLRLLNADGTYRAFTTLTISARYNGIDITNHLKNIVWERDSGDEDADTAWNNAHKSTQLNLPLTYNDLGNTQYRIGQVFFTCTAEYENSLGVQKAIHRLQI